MSDESIPLTPEIEEAILGVLRSYLNCPESEIYSYRIEGPKRDLGQAVLAALGLPLLPPPLPAPPVVPSTRRRWLPFALRARVFLRDGFVCLACASRFDLTVDHIVPVVAGGGDHESNLQTLCRSCNSKKGTRLE